MGVEIFFDKQIGGGFFFCNTSMTTFGDFIPSEDKETLNEFLEWWYNEFGDPRISKEITKQIYYFKCWLRRTYPYRFKYLFGDLTV